MPQRGCRAGRKRINSQAIMESKHDRKKLAIPPEGQEKTVSETRRRDKTATASEEPEEPGVRMSAIPDPEQLHVGPEEQDQNAGNIHDRVPEGLDAQGRARNTSKKIEVMPANQDNNLDATHVNGTSATVLEKEPDTHSSDSANGIEIDNTIDDNADMSSLAAGIYALHMKEGPKTSPRPWEEKVVRWRKQRRPLTAVPEQEQDQSES
ncbi:MAG: hypothetical protein Q9179_002463 [Wetmoreana sp. 5 TL-2023]